MQRRGRVIRVRSQAIAQNHQGPPGLMGHAGLGTTTARGHISAAVSSGNDGSASIIAPGREGSQSERRHTKARGNPEDLAGLGTTTARGACLSGSIEWGNASIIAPGREGSQLGATRAAAVSCMSSTREAAMRRTCRGRADSRPSAGVKKERHHWAASSTLRMGCRYVLEKP